MHIRSVASDIIDQAAHVLDRKQVFPPIVGTQGLERVEHQRLRAKIRRRLHSLSLLPRNQLLLWLYPYPVRLA
jgi:hypothetical protein